MYDSDLFPKKKKSKYTKGRYNKLSRKKRQPRNMSMSSRQSRLRLATLALIRARARYLSLRRTVARDAAGLGAARSKGYFPGKMKLISKFI